LLPWLFSEIVTAMTWRSVFHEPFGLLNGLLRQVGLSQVPWLGRPATAMTALIVASLWQGIGISALVILAALQNIPSRLMDLASIDGAVGLRRLLHVVLPQLKGVLLLDCMLVGIKSLGSFTLVFALTGGGPGYGTEILATYVYRLTFSHYELGYASAVGVCLAVLFLSLVAIVYLLQRAEHTLGYKG
jgi:multiple sugar transport system permease protein